MLHYYFCQVLLVLFFASIIFALYKEYSENSLSKKNIFLAILLTFLFKYNFGTYFLGIEYEDAYIFSACARMFEHGIYTSSFLTEGVLVGSLDNPDSLYTFGGHFILYSVYLSNFIKVFGYSLHTVVFANMLITFCIFLILSVFWKKNNYSWVIAPLLYACAPIINVFATSFLSEIFSSFICLTFLFFWNKFYTTKNKIYIILTFFAFFTAIMCKRENLALLLLPCIYTLTTCINLKKLDFLCVKYLLAYAIICIFYLLFLQNVFAIESIESQDIGNSTFRFEYFIALAPYFLQSLLSMENFSILGYIFIALLVPLLQKECFMRTALLSLFIAYFLLYSSHYRGYFFVKYDEISLFETFRYLNNFFYIIPLLISAYIIEKLSTEKITIKKIKYVYCSVILLALFSLFTTFSLRNEYSQLEYDMRIESTQTIVDSLNSKHEKYWIVTETPLVYQNLYTSDIQLYDMALYNENFFKAQDIPVYMELKTNSITYLKERYVVDIDLSRWNFILKMQNGNKLYRYVY